VLNAGGSINMADFKSNTVDLTARSGDINFNTALIDNSLVASAGRDIVMNSLFWIGPAPNMAAASGPVTLTAGRDIVATATSPIHVSNGQTLTFTANRNLTLFLLETLGAVNLTATTGNITLNNDIGGHILNTTSFPAFNFTDKGVASLSMTAGGSITMQGARAEGNVVITAGTTLNAAKQITSVSGSVTITTPPGGATLSAVPIGTQNQVDYPQPVSPVAPPGPKSPLPTGPWRGFEQRTRAAGLCGNRGIGRRSERRRRDPARCGQRFGRICRWWQRERRAERDRWSGTSGVGEWIGRICEWRQWGRHAERDDR
jgi:hypothetical protein